MEWNATKRLATQPHTFMEKCVWYGSIWCSAVCWTLNVFILKLFGNLSFSVDLHIICFVYLIYKLQGVRSDNKNVHCSFLSSFCLSTCSCVFAWFISIFGVVGNFLPAEKCCCRCCCGCFIIRMQICNFDQKPKRTRVHVSIIHLDVCYILTCSFLHIDTNTIRCLPLKI